MTIPEKKGMAVPEKQITVPEKNRLCQKKVHKSARKKRNTVPEKEITEPERSA